MTEAKDNTSQASDAGTAGFRSRVLLKERASFPLCGEGGERSEPDGWSIFASPLVVPGPAKGTGRERMGGHWWRDPKRKGGRVRPPQVPCSNP